jgi:hypothetical protein
MAPTLTSAIALEVNGHRSRKGCLILTKVACRIEQTAESRRDKILSGAGLTWLPQTPLGETISL